jgi:hypothetical protein
MSLCLTARRAQESFTMTDQSINLELHEIEDWLRLTREQLSQKWSNTTRHRPDASYGTWACEIATGCRTCNEHLSIPCSLLEEANEIGAFLSTQCYSENPSMFLRLYLIILSEFVGQLQDVAGLIGVRVKKPPPSVVVWANRWAKHKLHFMVQHHPEFVFADSFQEPHASVVDAVSHGTAIDECGRSHPFTVIDYKWFCEAKGEPDLNRANDERQVVVVVPPLMTFLDDTIRYFREFIDACLGSPELVRKFQSEHFTVRC